MEPTTTPWTVDGQTARRFLELLGKDPTTTRLRAFPHRRDPRRTAIGARKGPFDLRQAQRWQREGRGLYVVINDGGDRNSAIRRCRALFVEWDDRPLAWQREAWRELGLPEPTLLVATGGRSLHCYWVLREPIPPAQWTPLQRELIEVAGGDPSCGDAARVMRLPGSWYLDEHGQPLAQVVIEAASGQRYAADELAAALSPAALLSASKSSSTTPTNHNTAITMNTSHNSSPSWDDICAALAAIPPRVAGSNSYATYRNILWGLISACQEAGHAKEEAIALMEAHSPSGASGWDVRQVAYSGGEEISSATFWFHARRWGWQPEGEPKHRKPPGRHRPLIHRPAAGSAAPSAGDQGPNPGISAAGAPAAGAPTAGASGPGPGPRRGPKYLPLARRLDALDHCIHALLGREPNSLRRHARVRHAQAALELKALLRHQEIGQLILEAHDRRHGNRFQGLGSPQRLAMSVPQLEWEIPDCLPARDLTILGGRAKVGKTRLAHALLRCLLCAEDFLGFGAPSRPRPVILISDDQADGDTAQMLQASGMWGHPLLIWSRRFRATETNLEALRECLTEQGIASQGGAVVMLDSLRSITRSCCFGENDPEMGTMIYDLKHQMTDAGGTVLLVHHCNKANETTGTEALSGHNAIAGAANTILTLHYMSQENRLLKESPQRRLVREARSGPPVDLVVTMEDSGGRFMRIGSYSDVLEEQELQQGRQKALDRVQKATDEQHKALQHLLERHQRGEQGLPVLQLLQAVGAVPEAAVRMRDLEGEDLTRYKTLARLLTHLKGVVVSSRKTEEGGGYSLRYSLSTAGAKWLAEVLGS